MVTKYIVLAGIVKDWATIYPNDDNSQRQGKQELIIEFEEKSWPIIPKDLKVKIAIDIDEIPGELKEDFLRHNFKTIKFNKRKM